MLIYLRFFVIAMYRLNLVIWMTLLFSIGNAQAEVKFKNIGSGWRALVQQSDPFDSSKFEIVQIKKGDFTFRCNDLNMEVNSYGYESLSFNAFLKYVVDSNSPLDKKGGYSTYLGGSDLVTNSRYYYFKLNESDIEAFKKGNSLKVAGKYSSTGWVTKSLNLKGFTKAYSEMCD
ncbi:hypothetical protein [Photobacterium leiognathi]|uniref:hypothetical protein n=1 Tax=Photobacterium leiognathi TaxID=553611 RepID=UPI002736C72F|nr:hypothetical protein [Photobacterium leiognathi]